MDKHDQPVGHPCTDIHEWIWPRYSLYTDQESNVDYDDFLQELYELLSVKDISQELKSFAERSIAKVEYKVSLDTKTKTESKEKSEKSENKEKDQTSKVNKEVESDEETEEVETIFPTCIAIESVFSCMKDLQPSTAHKRQMDWVQSSLQRRNSVNEEHLPASFLDAQSARKIKSYIIPATPKPRSISSKL